MNLNNHYVHKNNYIFSFPFPFHFLFHFLFKVIEMSDFSFSHHLRSVKDWLQQCVISITGNEKIIGYKLNLPKIIASNCNYKDEIYIINFDADTLYQYLQLKQVSTRSGYEAKKILVRSFYNEVLNQYTPTSTFYQMLFFNNNNLILLGKLCTPNTRINRIMDQIQITSLYWAEHFIRLFLLKAFLSPYSM